MKRILLIAMAVLLVLALCACDKDQSNANANVQPGGSSSTNTTGNQEDNTQSTECTHAYNEAVTKEATCAEEGTKTFTCGKCGDTYTEAIAKTAHTYADATCTDPKTCSGCGATEGAALQHRWKDATCTAPKTCYVCDATEGEALGHSYSDGKCTRCKAKQENYKALNTGRWKLMAFSNDGELCKFSLCLQDGRQELDCGFGAELSTLDPEFQKDLLGTPGALVEFEGKQYYFGMGDGCELTYSAGTQVEIKLKDSDSRTEYKSTIVLERIAGDQLKVISVTGEVLETGAVKEGMIFTWAE